jgi:hypothetical protein
MMMIQLLKGQYAPGIAGLDALLEIRLCDKQACK